MIVHRADKSLVAVEVENTEEFALYLNDIGGTEYVVMDREQLTELRRIIDQALNTSAEELGDVE